MTAHQIEVSRIILNLIKKTIIYLIRLQLQITEYSTKNRYPFTLF